jgi:hypothetical protein
MEHFQQATLKLGVVQTMYITIAAVTLATMMIAP